MPGNLSTPGASVVERALALLFAFDARHPRLTVSELAERTGLPLATAHRLATQMVAAEALDKDEGGRYTVSRRIWQAGAFAPAETSLREVAAPFLNDLHAATRATVHLAVREGNRALYLERLYGHASVPVLSTVGSTMPMHATGVGKALLAFAPGEVVHHVMTHLTRHTPYTITSAVRLVEQLERVRREGVATTAEELTLGACSIAVPVRAGGASEAPVVAAIAVVVPSLRRESERLVAALQVAARGISRNLGSVR